MMTDYVLDYCNAVLSGEIVANEKIKLACKRELSDRKRINNDDSFNYYFDSKQAIKAIKFMSLIPKTDGTKLEMALFQKWLIGSLYGWREKGTGNRRYNKAFISMARKNSKTYVASCIAIASLLLEDKPAKNRQVLFVSNALKQAKIGYEMVSSELRQVVKLSPALRSTLDIKKKQITKLDDDSFIVPVAGKAETLDGFNPTTAIIDEYHQASNHAIYNVLKSGMGQQKNGLLCIISTSGFNLKGAMFEDYQVMADILNGKQENSRQFIGVWELDDREEVNDPDCWIKANPLFEVPAVKQLMAENLSNDIATARQQNDLVPVLVKQFNMWYQSNEDSFISHDEWAKTIVDKPDIHGKRVIFGIDLSKSNDLTSVSWIIPQDSDTYYCDSHSWVATKYGLVEKMKADNINYKALASAGECDITDLESGVINYQDVFDFIKRMVTDNDLKVEAICYDPWSFGYLLGQFEAEDWPLVETAQSNRVLSFPTKQFKEYLLNGQITHPNNHLLSIAVDNSVLIYDSTGNCRIDKTKHNNKIDPVAALLNAWVYTSNELIGGTDSEADNSYYESDEFTF
ncbi:terminase large subunit [Lactiplantibacillus plantarum]|uniref:terminase large subunit n=2 Tax=Lactiplantibacillus plantarum TaxID=1590 RepID=UPI0009B59483|nr:terminase TerL endonuclease subunit [Lactiplantibacillus plantarum]MZU59148.1 terminase large subunit [Lactiplantibacillus plantarum]MZU75900.1 terminase large subunit [Lactiplantibacillus plantarum]MZV43071.1 terminase large subunit [Lactiplantibacillus plantarum]PCE77666.1 terminase large subunit [Lactiplantibacillus plantarum]